MDKIVSLFLLSDFLFFFTDIAPFQGSDFTLFLKRQYPAVDPKLMKEVEEAVRSFATMIDSPTENVSGMHSVCMRHCLP